MKLRTCSKITWPHLGYGRGEYYFTFSLDFLLRFASRQNEEPKRLERNSKQILFILFQKSTAKTFMLKGDYYVPLLAVRFVPVFSSSKRISRTINNYP